MRYSSINNFKWRNGRHKNIIKSLEESELLIKRISEIINQAKEPKEGFLSMLLGTLAASILGNA